MLLFSKLEVKLSWYRLHGSNRLNHFGEYDPSLNNGKRKADFPGVARNGAVAIGTDSKGYVESVDDGNFLKNFWQYDPSTNQWK